MVVVDADEAVLWGGSGIGLVIRSASKGGELKKAVLLVGGKQNRLRVFYTSKKFRAMEEAAARQLFLERS